MPERQLASATTERTPGRPRDPEVELRAFAAARALYGESGSSAATFRNVAKRSGVGKAALYRRWSEPQDLLVAALRRIPVPAEIPDLGDAHRELAYFAREMLRLYISEEGQPFLQNPPELTMELITGGLLSHALVHFTSGTVPPEQEIEDHCHLLCALALRKNTARQSHEQEDGKRGSHGRHPYL